MAQILSIPYSGRGLNFDRFYKFGFFGFLFYGPGRLDRFRSARNNKIYHGVVFLFENPPSFSNLFLASSHLISSHYMNLKITNSRYRIPENYLQDLDWHKPERGANQGADRPIHLATFESYSSMYIPQRCEH